MTSDIRVLTLEQRAEWEREHAVGGLPGQSWSYCRALAPSFTDPRLAVVEAGSSRMLMPYVERSWRTERDVTTPVGLAGATIEGDATTLLELWRDYAVDQGWVAGYIQLAAGTDPPQSEFAGSIVSPNEVLRLELHGKDVLPDASDSIHKKIDASAARGTMLVADRERLASRFAQLYPETMERVGARADYRFAPKTLQLLIDRPDALVLGAELGGQLEAVCVFGYAGEAAEYQFNASSKRGREETAWLLARGIEQLVDQGVTLLNLGGGGSPRDGVWHFKRRLGGIPTRLHSVCQTYDPERYETLCRDAGVVSSSRFPAYREGS